MHAPEKTKKVYIYCWWRSDIPVTLRPHLPASWHSGNSPGGRETENRTDTTVCFKTRKKRRRWRKAAQVAQVSSERKHVLTERRDGAHGEPARRARGAGSAPPGWEKGDRAPVFHRRPGRAVCTTESPGPDCRPDAAQEYHLPVTLCHFPLTTHPYDNGHETHCPLLWLRVSSSPEAGGNIL